MKRYAYFRYPYDRKWHYNDEYEYRRTGYGFSCNMPDRRWYTKFYGLPYITKFYFDYSLENKRFCKLINEIMDYGDILFISEITELSCGREFLIDYLVQINSAGINLFVMRDWVDIDSTIEMLSNMEDEEFGNLSILEPKKLYVMEEEEK